MYRPRFKQSKIKLPRINQFIKVPSVRLVDETGKQVGIKSTQEALQMANEKGLDLIEVATNAQPPVAKIMNFNKWRYEEEKRQRERRKKTKAVETKEVRISVNIGRHDLETKAKQIDKFFKDGNIVSIRLTLKGREKAHQELAEQKINELLKIVGEHRTIQPIKKTPIGFFLMISKQ